MLHSEPKEMSEASYLSYREKKTGALLNGLKSSFQMKLHIAFHLEIKGPGVWGKSGYAMNSSCLKSGVKFAWSVMTRVLWLNLVVPKHFPSFPTCQQNDN